MNAIHTRKEDPARCAGRCSNRNARRAALRPRHKYTPDVLAIGAVLVSLALVSTASAQQGVQINVDADGFDFAGDAANESTLIFDPHDPQRIVVAWRQFTDKEISNREAGYAFSEDGGQTWTFPPILDHFPPYYETFLASDPVLLADADGIMHLSHIVWDLGDADQGVFVSHSYDRGRTWEAPTAVVETQGEQVLDKEWITSDQTGGPGHHHLYCTYGAFGYQGGLFVRRSVDRGLSFEEPVRISFGGTQLAMPAVGPDGELYILYFNFGDQLLMLTKSDNAMNPDQPMTLEGFGEPAAAIPIAEGTFTGMLGDQPVGAHQPMIAIDTTQSDYRGNLYLVWPHRSPEGDTDILFARSDSGGWGWTNPVVLNDDDESLNRDQFLPTLSIAPDGRIDVTFYDRRNDPENALCEICYTYSVDGGEHWHENIRLSEAFDPMLGFPTISQKIGEYMGAQSTLYDVRLAYTGTYTGEQNLYYITYEPYLGDLNGDGDVNFFDLNPFVLGLSRPDEYAQQFPGLDPLPRGDFNHDGRFNNFDIDLFVAKLFDL